MPQLRGPGFSISGQKVDFTVRDIRHGDTHTRDDDDLRTLEMAPLPFQADCNSVERLNNPIDSSPIEIYSSMT